MKADIERTRKSATEEMRARISAVNEAGKALVGEIDQTIDAVMAPVREAERIRTEREQQIEALIAGMRAASQSDRNPDGSRVPSADLRSRLLQVRNVVVTPKSFHERANEATSVQIRAIEMLERWIREAEEAEAQERELEELRREKAEREARARREAEAAEAEKRAERRAAELLAEKERREEELKSRKEKESERRAADRARREEVRTEISTQLRAHAGLSLAQSARVIDAIDMKKVPALSIDY
ncbi:MAG: hypothetical protein V2J24_23710 [Pseudomonadales bacterium]|nr:hypothetical protein [Pseudomonadales bacterium]